VPRKRQQRDKRVDSDNEYARPRASYRSRPQSQAGSGPQSAQAIPTGPSQGSGAHANGALSPAPVRTSGSSLRGSQLLGQGIGRSDLSAVYVRVPQRFRMVPVEQIIVPEKTSVPASTAPSTPTTAAVGRDDAAAAASSAETEAKPADLSVAQPAVAQEPRSSFGADTDADAMMVAVILASGLRQEAAGADGAGVPSEEPRRASADASLGQVAVSTAAEMAEESEAEEAGAMPLVRLTLQVEEDTSSLSTISGTESRAMTT
jgi:hypothetical protein